MDIDEQIRIMTAYRDGAEIERFDKHQDLATVFRDWHPNPDNIAFNFIKFDYRIKEKPKRVTLHYYRYPSGEVKIYNTDVAPYNGAPPELIYTQII